MAYELENIESKINDHISLAASDKIDFDVPEFLNDLDVECGKVKRAFRNQVVSFESDSLIKRYFHFHQESLIDLINQLQTISREGSGSALFASIISRLSGLLSYMEEHFPEYFDLDMKMPIVSTLQIQGEIKSFVDSVSRQFANTNVDIGLVALLKTSIERLADLGDTISFRKFYYLNFLRISISDAEESADTTELIRILIHCNFNDESFYNYLVKYIEWAVNKAQGVAEKLDQLAYFLKFVNQETGAPQLAYDPRSIPINIQTADWITQEMQYLRHKLQVMEHTMNAEDISSAEFKLNFDLSVSAVALLYRAFVETGVIQNKNTSELIRFLAKYVKTKRSESISFESLRIKYYSIESGTKDAVKKMLQSVINFINKN